MKYDMVGEIIIIFNIIIKHL